VIARHCRHDQCRNQLVSTGRMLDLIGAFEAIIISLETGVPGAHQRMTL